MRRPSGGVARGAALLLAVALLCLVVGGVSRATRSEDPGEGDATMDALQLRHAGWSFPDVLPGGLRLFTAEERRSDGRLEPAVAAADDDSDDYVHLGYTDGTRVLSVFIQRGRLDVNRLANWHARVINGHTIWTQGSSGTNAIWSSGDYVYTVLANAPADVMDTVVDALPHEGEPGFWERLTRGMDRVLAWANPFD